MADIRTWTRSLIATTGAAIAGPAGAIIGTFLGSIVASLLPGPNDFTNQVLGNLTRMSIDNLRKNFEQKLTPQEKQRVNHDLQSAFRDAVHEALLDIGGAECFSQIKEIKNRDVPAGTIFAMTTTGRTLWQRKDPLADQIAECLQFVDQAISSQAIFPLDPPARQSSASVNSYLQAETPEKLELEFFNDNFPNILGRFPTLHQEVPELEAHLRRHLFERTLVHLGEHLKHRTPAWRAFNRLVFESMQSELSQLVRGQSEILDRLKAINEPSAGAEFNGLTDELLDILAATGLISRQVEEGFESLSNRVISQHRELITRLDSLVAASNRIEKKVDRVLRFLGEGKYVIEGETNPYVIPKPPAPGDAPFKGLQNFTQNDSGLFFGRDEWIGKLVTRLKTTRFLAVIGASGSGKSSVVRAGVLPVLKNQKEIRQVEFRPAHSDQWPVHVITPTAHPLESLTSILSKADNPADFRAWTKNLHHYPHILDLTLRQQAQKASTNHVLIVVDQFEEVFTQCQDPTERADFIRALMDAADPDQPGTAVVIIILRADFYAQCAEYEQLRSAISKYQEYIGPMTQTEIRQAIEEPAAKLGWRFEPGLVEIIIQDAGNEPGMLPLLSHALLETWRNRSGHTMTLESYAETGGVKGAIAKTAEMVYRQQLTQPQQTIARNILLRLTNLGDGVQDARRRSSLAELIPSSDQTGAVEKVVNLLAEARLLTIEDGAVDVAHEALIREWPTLRSWIEENRAGLRIHQRLTLAAQEWQRFKRDEGLLYRGLRLQEALEWTRNNASSQNDLERVYIKTSQDLEHREAKEKEIYQRRELEAAKKLAETERQRAEEQRRSAEQLRRREYFLRIALIGAGVLAVFAVIFAIMASLSGKEANDKSVIAQAASTQAVAESQTRATAESNAIHQSRISQVREIASRARSLLNNNQEMAILIGVQAVKLAQTYGNISGTEATSALYQALNAAKFSITLHGHTNTLTMARFSPDGQKIVTASRDNTATLWGVDGRRLAVLTGHTSAVVSALFSPDGLRIVTASEDATARLWQPDGKLLRVLNGHSAPINQAVFSPDSRRLLTVSNDGTARIWDVASGNSVILQGHTDAVLAGAFNPDNLSLATAGADANILIWSVDGSLLKTLTGHTSWVVSLGYTHNGKKLVSASWDKTAKIWHLDDQTIFTTTLNGHKFPLNYAAFNPDGTKVVTSGTDNQAKIWSASGDLIADLPGHTQQINRSVFSPDGTIVMTASLDNTVRMWQSDGTPLAVLRGHSGFVYDASFSPDGSRLVTASADETARIWQTDQLVQIFQDHYGAATTAAFSPDGKMLLTGSTDGVIRVHRKDGVTLNQFYSGGPTNKAVFSPDGKQILVASNKNVAILFNLNGDKIVELAGHTQKLNDARFSPDGNRILTASADGNAILWQKDGKPITTLSGHTGPVSSARFSPDGSMIVTASEDKTIRFWKADGTRLPTVITAPEDASNASFSPDGTRIIAGCWNGSAYLWKLDGTLVAEYKGHTGGLTSAEFSPDGKLILTASVDGTARLWNSDGTFLAALEGHTSWVNSADFSSDGLRIMTTSWDGTARMWIGYTNAEQMISESALRVGRSIMTQVECQTYLYMNNCP